MSTIGRMSFFFFYWLWCPREVYDTRLFFYLFHKPGIVFPGGHITETTFVGNSNMILSHTIEVDVHIFFCLLWFMMMLVEIWLYRRHYEIRLIHTRDIHFIAHFMEVDVSYIEELIPYTSLICLYRWYIVKFCKSRILHKYRPADIDDTAVSDNPDITVPIEDLVQHDKKHEKHIGLK